MKYKLKPANDKFQEVKFSVALYVVLNLILLLVSFGLTFYSAYEHHKTGVFIGVIGILISTLWFIVVFKFAAVLSTIVKIFKEFGFEKDL